MTDNPMAKALAERGGEEAKARKLDGEFYPTPPEVTVALLRAEKYLAQPRTIWEPHCGEGAICDVLAAAGHDVWGSDLRLRDLSGGAYTWQRWPEPLDFGAAKAMWFGEPVDAILMNPPFTLAKDHIRHALSFNVDLVACLLPANFWFSNNRSGHVDLFNRFPPSTIYPCAWRADFTGDGSNMFNVQWCVWRRSEHGRSTTYRPLVAPELGAEVFIYE